MSFKDISREIDDISPIKYNKFIPFSFIREIQVCCLVPMCLYQSAPRHTPKRQNFLATTSKAVGQLPHQLSTCRGIKVARCFKNNKC
jgi:hypothetical protein